tara:strand:- start:15 stop:290 length:276 start_codon:yes stop_codon:yes gene_type:complete
MTVTMEKWGHDVFHDAETQKYKIPAKIINGLRSFGIEAKTGVMSVNEIHAEMCRIAKELEPFFSKDDADLKELLHLLNSKKGDQMLDRELA